MKVRARIDGRDHPHSTAFHLNPMLARRYPLVLGLPLAILLAVAPIASAAVGQRATRFPGEDRELIVAIVRGDTDAVTELVRADSDAARRLLGDGPRRNGYDSRETALSISVRNHRMDIARVLLDAGADPGREGGANVGLLGRAQFPEMVALLLEHGADPHAFAASLPSGKLGVDFDTSPRARAVYRALVGAGIELDRSAYVRLGWSDGLAALPPAADPSGGDQHALLYHAIERGDSEMLAGLLKQGVPTTGESPRSPFSNWRYPGTVLAWALFFDDAKGALALLDAGAPVDPDARGWDSKPGMRLIDPTEWLAESGDLLDRAIDIGDVELFDALTRKGLDPARSNVLQGNETEILHDRMLRAAWRGHRDVLFRLIEAPLQEVPLLEGAVERGVAVRFSRLQLAAAASGHGDLHRSLVKRSPSTSPHAAAALGEVDVLRDLIKSEPSALESRDPICDATPLAWAVISERVDTVTFLVALGADVDATVDAEVAGARWEGRPGTRMPEPQPYYDETDDLPRPGSKLVPLLQAALRRGNLEVASLLIGGGVKVQPDALTILARDSSPEAGRLLRNALEGDLVVKEDVQWAHGALSALVGLTRNDAAAVERIDLLLEHGAGESVASPDARSIVDGGFRAGASPELLLRFSELGSVGSEGVEVALGWRSEPPTRLFLDSLDVGDWESLLHRSSWRPDAEPYTRVFALRTEVTVEQVMVQVHRLAYSGRLDLIDVAVRRGPADYDLHRDAEVLTNGADYPDFVRELLRRGADPNLIEPDGFGPLHRAARAGALESVRLLLMAGADPQARSFNGRAPLFEVTMAADRMGAPGKEVRILAVIEALLEAGADPLSVDDVGRVTYEQILWRNWSKTGRATLIDLLSHHVDPEWL